MQHSPRVPSVAPFGLRLLGRPAADPHDVGARLDRVLQTASRGSDGRAPRRTQPVQAVADAHHDPEAYRRWRAGRLLQVSGGDVPELLADEWACVLWTMAPSALADFGGGVTQGLLGPPLVGRFGAHVTLEVGLAATLTAWLTGRHALALAPPLVRQADGAYRLVALRRAWPLRAAEL